MNCLFRILIKIESIFYKNEEYCDDCQRKNIFLINMKMNHVYEDQKISLWIVTRPEPTNLIDGTIYMIVRDQFDFHVRLGKFFQ